MPGELPFFIEGKVTEVSISLQLAYVRVKNGNVYHVYPNTKGIDYARLAKGTTVRLEVTSMLIRVLSAEIIE